MARFTDSADCAARLHCETCRAREAGRAFRVSLGGLFALPPGAPDFPCPHGRRWNWRPAWYRRLWAHWRAVWRHPSRGLGDTIAKLTRSAGVSPCGGCKERQEWANEKVPYEQAKIAVR